MFDVWNIKKESDLDEKRIKRFNFHRYDKLKLTKSAQQKLSKSIYVKPGIYVLEDENDITNFFCPFKSSVDEYSFLLSNVNFEKRKIQNNIRKWIIKDVGFAENQIKISKASALKETIKMSSSCKSLIQNCCKEGEMFPRALKPEKSSPFFIEIPYATFIFPTNIIPKHEKWNSTNNDLNIQEVLVENAESPDINSIISLDDIVDIPKKFFVGDYLQSDILLPLFRKSDKKKISHMTHVKWKFKKKVSWMIEENGLRSILDEPIHRFEIKYKVYVANIMVQSSYSENLTTFFNWSLKPKWNFSEYKTCLLNWKPFGKLSLEEALEEDVTQFDVNIPILSEKDEENYIKMSELTKDINSKPINSYLNFPVGTNNNSENNNFVASTNITNNETKVSIINNQNLIFNNQQNDSQYDAKDNSLIKDNNNNISPSSSQNVNIFEVDSSNLTIESNTTEYKKKETIGISPKRSVSQLDSIILRKKKKARMAKFDFSKKYPYLDILNQSSSDKISPKLANNISDSTITDSLKDNILEVSEFNLDNEELQVLEIPESKFCNVMLNIEFAEKFGAAFNKFSNTIGSTRNIILNEFEMPNYDLKFDMFLNPTCGVLFFRPINMYQIDLSTGENLVIKQISEISHQVLSLIVVIAIDDSINIESDVKIKEFMELVENYGIQLFVINNDYKTISMSMFELIQKYSNIAGNEPFLWTPEHRFLENCGIINPFLSDCILSHYKLQDFVNLPLDKRTGFLLRFCTAELTNHINKAVQSFTEME